MIDVKTANVKFLDGDFEGAARDYLTGAEEGDPMCAFNYAYCLYRGKGVERDAESARSFFSFARELVGEANYNLACMYIFGTGVKKNYKKAYDYMHAAAEKGVVEAQLYLGVAHVMGAMFEPEVRFLSMIPYHKQEYVDSDAFLLDGEISLEEFEADDEARVSAVRQDDSDAFHWFAASARNKTDYAREFVTKGRYLHALCYIDEIGVGFDLKKGNTLMLKAAVSGSGEALEYLQTRAPYVLESVKDKKILAILDQVGQMALGGAVPSEEE